MKENLSGQQEPLNLDSSTPQPEQLSLELSPIMTLPYITNTVKYPCTWLRNLDKYKEKQKEIKSRGDRSYLILEKWQKRDKVELKNKDQNTICLIKL